MLGVAPIGTNIFQLVHVAVVYINTPQLIGCFDVTDISPKLITERELALLKFLLLVTLYTHCVVLYLTRCSSIAVDIIVLVLTWIKSFKQFKDMRRLELGFSISAVLLRDGNFAELGNYSNPFIRFVPPLLIQRFILNLRQPNHTANDSSSDTHHLSHLSFRVSSDFLGNIGAPLDHSQSEQVEGSDNNNSRAEEEPRNESEEVSVHLSERASDENIIGQIAYSHGIVAGPSTSTH
ncbi:uncharacterized protein PHACADRAFT_207584 [Phanerochaete carnosa HHB-10118-sp]|uniref:Uncharacterized protein n=1 Tax=Phanerochaete carnosa (strain HHB-10118-sp) TaxID=650164 RepID=K5WAU9_PHACS|nr:uncharacterized protein PHACADRAFT_207584 [Phanerochaete carnosa HHB-10118-sp]EKM56310.1 hypothetical protein PHACADRAFT_207584 [Phanerochaete carnosa HHB-10118-sp]